jgi:hypothetical protein
MAKIIKFHIPAGFRPTLKGGAEGRGEVIEFVPKQKKSA